MIRPAIVAILSALGSLPVAAQDVTVRGYTRNDGTYVQPYHRTAPNNTLLDNYSARGNVNPYTGRAGTVDPYQQPSNPYGSFNNNYGTQPYGGLGPRR